MKKVYTSIAVLLLSAMIIIGCQKDSAKDQNSQIDLSTKSPKSPPSPEISCTNYIVDATKSIIDGNTLITWTVRNNNPGNGSNGTSKDLSHWNLFLPACIDFSKVLAGYMSMTYYADLSMWTAFTPTNQPDPSQTCTTDNVIKFNLGTSGTNTTYYALLLKGTNYAISSDNKGLFKAGTGCCTAAIKGVTCSETAWCPYSQGYWVAKPDVEWCQLSVTFTDGASHLTVTKDDGRALWPAQSNTMKKAFFQASALQLSICMNSGADIPNSIINEYNYLKKMLAHTTFADISANTAPVGYTLSDIQTAAGKIGSWISANHCTDSEDDLYNGEL